MHLLVRETRTLQAEEAAADLGQTAADLVLLSFSDSDLGAAAAAWEAMDPADRPGLRLANLSRLRHPMSVDLYAEQVIAGARCVVLRLLGGLEYFRYGAEEFAALCRARGIALAVLPGDRRDDPALAALSTVPPTARSRLDAMFAEGGPENLRRALLLAAHLAGLREDPALPPHPLPAAGELPLPAPAQSWAGAAIVFYRSHLQAGDIAPIEALAAALGERGIAARAIYAASLKDPACAAYVAHRLAEWRPRVVLNATAFSAAGEAGSPLEAAGAPVLQLVLAGSPREAWAASARGLSPTDLAMHVVLPELDGHLLTGAISFKAEAPAQPELQYGRTRHAPDADGIALAADRACGWARLAATPAAARRLAIVLSDYPGAGGGGVGQAVGLDSFASLDAMLQTLAASGYATAARSAEDLVAALCHAAPLPFLNLSDYRRLFATLPAAVRDAVTAAWGAPQADPAVRDGAFTLRHLRLGNVLLAVQPDRGARVGRKAGCHDPDQPPRHAYVAFYLHLREAGIHAMVHLGAHGTLEWLPGKATALSPACVPAALLGGVPVIYPFIANNPGEAAAAKRRLGAVTIGHLTPPLRNAGSYGAAAELERQLEEYAAADGMDRRRNTLLRRAILDRAEDTGLLAESGADPGLPEDDRLARLDAFLCDVKDASIRDGLHVFGQAPGPEAAEALLACIPGADAAALEACASGEQAGLLAALDGRFVPPGPAGAPTRGRADVLPTGRNLYTTDPRLLPTRTAVALAEKQAAELLRRHAQDHGEPPRTIVLNLWGSATMRTGGEDLALALLLLGVRPTWDPGSGRVTGFEVEPLATLDRPRLDVTLRVSGLFRDAFAPQIALFDAAVRAIAERDEAEDWNPLAAYRDLPAPEKRAATARVYGPAPGGYGTGLTGLLQSGDWTKSAALGAAYLAGSAFAYGRDLEGAPDPAGLADRVRSAEAFMHAQDHREADLLEGAGWAEHEGGFAAAASSLGATPALYHADTAEPDRPRIRTLAEEIARMTRARAANPAWIGGMRRHGYRGATEIARAVEGLHAFAACVPARFDRQFELLFAATIGDPETDAFLQDANPAARASIAARFADARERDWWRPRRNDLGPLP